MFTNKIFNKIFKNNTFLLSILVFFSLCATVYGVSLSDGSSDISSSNLTWNSIKSKYAVINYQSLEDLAKFNKKVEYGEKGGFNFLFFGLGTDKLITGVSKKVDLIYERVQEILDMHRRMKKITINIYHNKDDLHKAYSKIYNEPCNIRAWYIFDKNTVYINVNDLHEGMLAHEMAHSIIDHYLLISPPPASAEILARYVDSHLHNKAISKSLKTPHTLSSFSEE